MTKPIDLPFPPAILSGHNSGHWRGKSPIVAKHRSWANIATRAANIDVPATGDVLIQINFYPPDRRGDRVNFPNRCKPYFDGIADALGINDSRFLPAYYFHEPAPPGKVEFFVSGRKENYDGRGMMWVSQSVDEVRAQMANPRKTSLWDGYGLGYADGFEAKK